MRMLLPAFALLLVTAAGCGKPRSTDEIFAEKLKLPQVYVGVKSFAQIIDAGDKGTIVDPTTGEEFFPALECANPNCPGRKGNAPVLFALPRAAQQNDCPHCLAIRKPSSETREDKSKYAGFIRPYVLPATQARQERLDAEFQRSSEYEARQRR